MGQMGQKLEVQQRHINSLESQIHDLIVLEKRNWWNCLEEDWQRYFLGRIGIYNEYSEYDTQGIYLAAGVTDSDINKITSIKNIDIDDLPNFNNRCLRFLKNITNVELPFFHTPILPFVG